MPLSCVAVCCSVLQCVAVCCSVLQCVAVCCNVLQCVGVCCTVLHYVALCVAVCCSFFIRIRHAPRGLSGLARLEEEGVFSVCCCCSVLQYVSLESVN